MQKGNPLTPVLSKHTFALPFVVFCSCILLKYARLSSTKPTDMSLICSTELERNTKLNTLLFSAEICSPKLHNINNHELDMFD